jgi:hypothetical protein
MPDITAIGSDTANSGSKADIPSPVFGTSRKLSAIMQLDTIKIFFTAFIN